MVVFWKGLGYEAKSAARRGAIAAIAGVLYGHLGEPA